MASYSAAVAAVTDDAISSKNIRKVEAPSVVNLFASAVTKSDRIGLRLGNTVIMDDGRMNLEIAADVIDTSRDQLTFNTVVGTGGGDLELPISAVTTEVQYLLSVEPII